MSVGKNQPIRVVDHCGAATTFCFAAAMKTAIGLQPWRVTGLLFFCWVLQRVLPQSARCYAWIRRPRRLASFRGFHLMELTTYFPQTIFRLLPMGLGSGASRPPTALPGLPRSISSTIACWMDGFHTIPTRTPMAHVTPVCRCRISASPAACSRLYPNRYPS
jgi:hypothetical protein